MTELIAVPFGKQKVSDYEHFFFGQDVIPTTEESTFEELRALHKISFFHEEDVTDSEIPIGFWLLTKESYTAIEIVANTPNHSERCVAKAIEEAAKRLCRHLAVKTLGTIP